MTGNGDMTVKSDGDVMTPPVSVTTENEIQRTLTNIHSVAKHLLHVEDADGDCLVVGVHPTGKSWRVVVEYANFLMETVEQTLGEALATTLQMLMAEVTRKLEESTRIIAALGEDSGARDGTRLAIIEECKRVPLVSGVDVQEPNAPGVVEIRIVPSRVTTIEERDEMCFTLGQRLERHRPASVRYDVRVIGSVMLSEADE